MVNKPKHMFDVIFQRKRCFLKRYQVEEKHDFDGDPDGAVADAEDDVGLNVAAVREVSGDSNRQVDQEQN